MGKKDNDEPKGEDVDIKETTKLQGVRQGYRVGDDDPGKITGKDR